MNDHIFGDVLDYVWVDKIEDGKLAEFFVKGAKLDKMKKALSNTSVGKKIKLYKQPFQGASHYFFLPDSNFAVETCGLLE